MAEPGSPLFVVGTPRSGTTLVSEVLGAHPDVAMAPETHYYNVFALDCDREDCLAEAASRRGYVERLLASEAFARMDLPADVDERVLAALEAGDEPGHGDVLGTILAGYADELGAARPGEKTPRHVEWVPRILDDFPEGRVVSVVRDPRDVALSQDRAPWESTVWRSAKEWRRHQAMADDHREAYPERFREVRYEDLLEDPAGVVEDLCGFLDLDYQDRMLAFHEEETTTFEEDQEPWKEKAKEPIDPSNKGKWRDGMRPEERWIVERVAGDGMAARGYERSSPELGLGGRARLAGLYAEHLVRWGIHQARWILDDKILAPDYASPFDEDG